MRISIICYDMSHNCLGRAYLLGRVLRRRYEVDIHGFNFSGGRIWKPCDTGEFEYRTVRGRSFPAFFLSLASMVRDIRGDVVYASKLRVGSYGAALVNKIFHKRPVVLDIDDDETAWSGDYNWLGRWASVLNPAGPLQAEWIEGLAGRADDITTVSARIRDKYGRGVLVPHGKDTDLFDPARFDRDRLRQQYNIDKFKVIMFLGSPRPHKGLGDIIRAMDLLGRDDLRFMVIGKGSAPHYEKELQEAGGGRVILVDEIPFNEVPGFLCMADLVVLPQKRSPKTQGQVPAKVFDAMAMARPVIASNVSDLPAILEGCGIIVEPGDIEALAEKIDWVLTHRDEAGEMGKRARERCIEEYSWDVMEERLAGVFEKYR